MMGEVSEAEEVDEVDGEATSVEVEEEVEGAATTDRASNFFARETSMKVVEKDRPAKCHQRTT